MALIKYFNNVVKFFVTDPLSSKRYYQDRYNEMTGAIREAYLMKTYN